ncbi:MAG: HAD-IA family hydrolase, partial [Bacteroidota bacterium]
RQNLTKKLDDLCPIEGIDHVLSRLAKDYTLGIVTSNSERNINLFLKKYGLDEHFRFQYTGIKLFNKSTSIKALLKKYAFDKNSVLVVGDETRDIEAARKCKLSIVSVSWGFHTSDLLRKHNPDKLVNQPKDLLDLLL